MDVSRWLNNVIQLRFFYSAQAYECGMMECLTRIGNGCLRGIGVSDTVHSCKRIVEDCIFIYG